MTESPGKLFSCARYAALFVAASLLAGCSIRGLAIDALAKSLAESGDVFASDEDPELVRQALPFALKTIESLLAEKPDHPGLLVAACSGFTQYGYAFVESDAAYLEEQDWEASEAQYQRALKLYLRARGYCLHALELASPGVRRALEAGEEGALASFAREDVPLLFWSGASWGAAISLALDRPEIAIDLPAVRALIDRSLELDEAWDAGSVHEVMMSLEALPEAMGGSTERARRHFDRAVELSGGHKASPYLRLATGVALPGQDRGEFERLLDAALAIEIDADPTRRLANITAQRRAAYLKQRVDDLFLPEEEWEGEE